MEYVEQTVNMLSALNVPVESRHVSFATRPLHLSSPSNLCFVHPTMSLPQYRLHDEENDIESINDFDQPLLSKKAQDDSSPPTYPPRLGGSSAIPGSSTTYHFVPRWPIKGNPESVLGVAGDKDVSGSRPFRELEERC